MVTYFKHKHFLIFLRRNLNPTVFACYLAFFI